MDTQTRSMTIPVSADDEHYRRIVGSLRSVRAATRQCYAVLFSAQAAGADIEQDADGNVSVKPSNERAREILVQTMGKTGKAPCYQLRDYVLSHLCPSIRSFVWDDLRRRVWTRWQARDPEFPRAGMGWLALQNVRGLAAFRFSGIGFPTAVLKSDALADHAVKLEWDRDLGTIELHVGTLDPGRWHRWKRVVSGETEHGTIILNERDGKLSLQVSYEQPLDLREVEESRHISLCVSDDGAALLISGPDGERTHDRIELCEAIAWCDRLKVQQDVWSSRRGACGSPRRPWGEPRRFRAVAEHQNRITRCREHGMHGRNHAWAKRIVTRAADWRCGVVEMSAPEATAMGGHPWGWHHFEQVMTYKLGAIGSRFAKLTSE